MKFFYTATVIAAALLTCEASAQSLKATSPHASSLPQLSIKAPAPEGRSAIMAAKGIARMPLNEETNAARGGVGNDDCATAQAITMISLDDCATNATVGNNSGASNGVEVPGCDDPSVAGFQDVWYSFNSGAYTIANITLTPTGATGQDWGYVVYDACGGAEVACEIGPSGPQQVSVAPGMDYYIRVFSNLDWGTGGPFTLCIAAPATAPANDGCSSTSVDLAAGTPITFTGTTVGATNTGDFVSGSELDGENPTVWHSFTTSECTDVTISYCSTDSVFANVWIFLAPSCPAGDDYILASTYDFTTCVDGNATLVYTYLPAGTYYLPVMFDATDANGPYSINVSAEACAPGYCIPMSANGPSDGDFIANVTLGSINNTTGGDNAYEDYTAQSTLLAQGGSYTLSITSGTYGEDYYAAWIDFNADTIFQSSEKIGEFEGTTPGELITLPFTVPADATLGTTRLRVRGAYNAANMEPCASYSFSETEDYSVEIELGTGLQEFQASDLVIYPNPTKGDLTISGADLSGSVEFELTDMTGRVVYRHQQSMSAGQPVTLPLNGKLAQGTYTLRLISANGISSRPVMVK